LVACLALSWKRPDPENLFREEELKVFHGLPEPFSGQGYPD
jgi:hypothetical protein